MATETENQNAKQDDPTKNHQDRATEISQEQAEAQRAEQAKRAEEDAEKRENQEATTALDAKSPAALADPDKDVGDHYAQKFANQPENPKPAPHLKEVADEDKVRMELTDSDHPDPANPKVTYVHPDMVGDYLRAGWRQPSV